MRPELQMVQIIVSAVGVMLTGVGVFIAYRAYRRVP